jgi:hypothetical protein
LIAGANMFVMKPPELDVLKRTIDRAGEAETPP